MGFAISGRSVHCRISPIIGKISSGPSEQLIPIASAPRPCNVTAMQGTVVPVNVLPSFSKLMVTQTGRLEFSLAASTAARASWRSVNVSNTTRSAPACSPAMTISLKMSYASSNERVPRGFIISPIGPISRATRTPLPADAALRAIAVFVSMT